MNIGQILKVKARGVATAQPNDTVQHVATLLAQRKIGAVVIVGNGGRVAGIMSERDIIRMISEHGVKALEMPVASGMTQDVKTCTRYSTLDEIMETMTKSRLCRLNRTIELNMASTGSG